MNDDITYVKELDSEPLIWINEGCKTCGKITLRIPHLLLIDMLKNCEQSVLRDMLIMRLQEDDVSEQLRHSLEANHIFDKLNSGGW